MIPATVELSERFYSPQGEGPWAGRPCFFIRLARCDLDCPSCDTPYTWRWQGLYVETPGRPTYDPAKEIATTTVATLLAEAISHRARRVVITGGEPMLQRNGLLHLAETLHQNGIGVALETNGRHKPSRELAAVVDLFVVSPKLASFGIERDRAIRPSALAEFNRIGFVGGTDRVAFKFVAANVGALDEIESVVDQVGIPAELVWVMPEGIDHATVTIGLRDLATEVLQRGWNLSGRMHVAIWGDQRGF